jgi:serine/threonine protein kinase
MSAAVLSPTCTSPKPVQLAQNKIQAPSNTTKQPQQKLCASARFTNVVKVCDTLQGALYKAKDIITGKSVVIKKYFRKCVEKNVTRKGQHVEESYFTEVVSLRMCRAAEKQSLSSSNKNIIKLIHDWQSRNSYYLALEHCKGGDLLDFINDEHPKSNLKPILPNQKAPQNEPFASTKNR